jgi:uncharacterized protein (DUF983 family)
MEAKQSGAGIQGPPSMAKAILTGKCPVCRSGEVFRAPMWNLKQFIFTHSNCPHCGVQFEPEPGFFIGAMYVNYACNVATIAAVGLFVWLVFNPVSIFAYAIPIIAAVVMTIPITTRLSRMIMLHVFGPFRFDPSRYQAQGTKTVLP